MESNTPSIDELYPPEKIAEMIANVRKCPLDPVYYRQDIAVLDAKMTHDEFVASMDYDILRRIGKLPDDLKALDTTPPEWFED